MARRPRSKKAWLALLDRYDEAIRAAFMEAISEVTSSIALRQLAAALERGDLSGAVEALSLEGAAFRAVDEAVRQAYTAGAVDVATSLPPIRAADGGRVIVRFDVRAPSAERWLKEHSSSLITRLVEEQREVVRAALVTGVKSGQNPFRTALDIAGRVNPATGRREGGLIGLSGPQQRTMAWVRSGFSESHKDSLQRYLGLKLRDKRFDATIRKAIKTGELSAADAERIAGALADRYLKHRADVIARTESLASLNAGRTETFRQAAIKAGIDPQHITRKWSATGDKKVRDTHRELDGQKVVGLDSAFTSQSGARLLYPGDISQGAPASEVVQCRCRVDMRVDYFEGRA